MQRPTAHRTSRQTKKKSLNAPNEHFGSEKEISTKNNGGSREWRKMQNRYGGWWWSVRDCYIVACGVVHLCVACHREASECKSILLQFFFVHIYILSFVPGHSMPSANVFFAFLLLLRSLAIFIAETDDDNVCIANFLQRIGRASVQGMERDMFKKKIKMNGSIEPNKCFHLHDWTTSQSSDIRR